MLRDCLLAPPAQMSPLVRVLRPHSSALADPTELTLTSLPTSRLADLFKHVIGPTGLLKDKARVLCTNSFAFLALADRLLMLRAGEIAEQAKYSDVVDGKDSPLYKLITGLGRSSGACGSATPKSTDDTLGDNREVKVGAVSEKVGGADAMAAATSHLM